MNWFTRMFYTPAPTPKRKTILLMFADGKRHRAYADTHEVVGKTAMRRLNQGLRKVQVQQSSDRGSDQV